MRFTNSTEALYGISKLKLKHGILPSYSWTRGRDPRPNRSAGWSPGPGTRTQPHWQRKRRSPTAASIPEKLSIAELAIFLLMVREFYCCRRCGAGSSFYCLRYKNIDHSFRILCWIMKCTLQNLVLFSHVLLRDFKKYDI